MFSINYNHFVSFLFVAVVFVLLLPRHHAFSELRGTRLKGCVLLEDPYIIKDPLKRRGYSGIAITYLDLLQDYLEFSIDLVQWNSSWSGFIDKMAICSPKPNSTNPCPCDIGIGSFTMTNERAEKINFVHPFSNEAHHMIAPTSNMRVDDSDSRWFEFRTFSWTVWMLIIFLIILYAIGVICFGPFRPKPCRTKPKQDDEKEEERNMFCNLIIRKKLCWQMKRIPAAIIYAYSHFIGHPTGHTYGTPSIHKAAWYALGITSGIFILTVYEASLTVLLFESTRSSIFKSIHDFQECNLNPRKVAVIAGGASQAFWNSAINNTIVRGQCGWESVGIPVQNIQRGFEMVKDGEADYFFSLEGSVTVIAHRNCSDVVPVGEQFFSTSVGFVLARETDERLSKLLSNTTRILREQDAYDTARTLGVRTECSMEIDPTVTASKLVVFFYLYLVVWILLVGYRCAFLWVRSRRGMKDGKKSDDLSIRAIDLAGTP